MKIFTWSHRKGSSFSFTGETEEEAKIMEELKRLIETGAVKVSRKSFYFSEDSSLTLEFEYK